MSIYLLLWSGLSAESTGLSVDELGRQLANEEGLEVVRSWATPQPYADFLVVREQVSGVLDSAAHEIAIAASWVEITQGQEPTASEDAILESLPEEAPETLLELGDVASFAPGALGWCERCRAFHARGRHIR